MPQLHIQHWVDNLHVDNLVTVDDCSLWKQLPVGRFAAWSRVSEDWIIMSVSSCHHLLFVVVNPLSQFINQTSFYWYRYLRDCISNEEKTAYIILMVTFKYCSGAPCN